MNRAQAHTAAADLARSTRDAAFAGGLAMLKADFPELLLPAAQRLSDRSPDDARLAQLLGLAARAVGESALALDAFRRAAALAPHDALIAHSHARAALEAGYPAVALFETARRLAPADGPTIQGHAAALVAEARPGEADTMLSEILEANPLWLDGYGTLAQIRGQHDGEPLSAIEAALTRLPASRDLHLLRVSTLLTTRRVAEAPAAVAAAEAALGASGWLALYRAHVASELGQLEEADRYFALARPPATHAEAALVARHAIKAGRPEEASAIADRWREGDVERALWPYAALAWRMTGDPRAGWLEGSRELVGVYDLADRIEDLPGLAEHLRALHTAQTAPLDQSVRGGTQTDGNLLLRTDPPIQALRALLQEAVAEHIARLPSPQPGHPTLIARREPQRIAGSWSVRLQGAGFHADHVHPQGWLSSAFYVALPGSQAGTPSGDAAGWLSLGECRELVPTLAPQRLIEPRPGRLVLFPSTMWHGTRPFPAGERLTVAFDIARPKQD